jgi:nucleoporin POM34
MATRTLPATPVTPSAQRPQLPATPTGAWKHPKFDEITRRQYATTFDDRNVKTIIFNLGILAVSYIALSNWCVGLSTQLPTVRTNTSPRHPIISILLSTPWFWWSLQALRLIPVTNIGVACYPLVRRYYPDDIADIPLTPSQRQTMGLDPNVATPQTPGSAYASPNYVTPPRYQKSTPRSSFSYSGGPNGESPLSGSPRASMGQSTSNSPFSPNAGSPLFQRAVGGGSAKRLSFDSRGSPMSSSLFGDSSASNTPGTPTPGTGKATVGLNNKWLYEKRRDSPRSNMFN